MSRSLIDTLPQYRSRASIGSNRTSPVDESTPWSVYDNYFSNSTNIYGPDLPQSSRWSWNREAGHAIRKLSDSRVVQGAEHVDDTLNVHEDQSIQHGSYQDDRYSEMADYYSKIAALKAIAQSAIDLEQLGRSPIDEGGSDGSSIGQWSFRPIQLDPKKRRTESSDEDSVPLDEMEESSLHFSTRKRVRFSTEESTSEFGHPDEENPLCEHNMIKESNAKGNEAHTQQTTESKKGRESSQKSEVGNKTS